MHTHTKILKQSKNHTGKKEEEKKSILHFPWSILQTHPAPCRFFCLFSICFLSVSFHLSFQHLPQMWDRDWQLSFSKLCPTHRAHETRGKHRPSNQKQKSLVNNVTYTVGHSLVNNVTYTGGHSLVNNVTYTGGQSGKQCKTHFTLEDTV